MSLIYYFENLQSRVHQDYNTRRNEELLFLNSLNYVNPVQLTHY